MSYASRLTGLGMSGEFASELARILDEAELAAIITSGTIDGAVIGGTTPAAGTFTTVAAALHAFSGLTGNTAMIDAYQATVTVANGATTGKEAAIGIPAHFLPVVMLIHCTVAATNACSLVDVGTDADTDAYCDGIGTIDLTSTGFKGIVGCNGLQALGDITNGVKVADATADEVEIVVSGDPGATGVTVRLTFIGIVAT
jgi:hypothetical protein